MDKLNAALTSVVAVIASVATIFSYINKTRLETANAQIAAANGKIAEFNSKLKDLEVTEKEAKERSDYADLFLNKVLPDPALKDNVKHAQALLSILNINAQSSEQAAKARALMPLQLALLLGQPGGVAAMDQDYAYLDDWVAMAMADNSPNTRLTAIQALAGVCQKALGQRRLSVVWRGVKAVDQLLDLIPDDQATLRASAIAARSQLASFITKEDVLLKEAKLDPGDNLKADAVRADIHSALSDATSVVQDSKTSLQSTYEQLQGAAKPDTTSIARVRATLGQLDAALRNASQVKVQLAIKNSPGTAAKDPVIAAQDAAGAAVEKALPSFVSSDINVRRKARLELALFGQDAVKPLLAQAAKIQPLLAVEAKQPVQGADKARHDDHLIRIGVATTLELMRQPISLDDSDAYWVADLLRARDGQIRRSVEEFLMNLESGDSIRNCFDALEPVFYELLKSPQPPQGDTVASIAAIVGTWSRNITPDTQSREPGKSFPTFALETSKKWRSMLATADQKKWAPVLGTLDELIARAEQQTSKSKPTVAAQ